MLRPFHIIPLPLAAKHRELMETQFHLLARHAECEARGVSPGLLLLRDTVRELPVALAAYVNKTEQGEKTRDRVAVSLYFNLPVARRIVCLGAVH